MFQRTLIVLLAAGLAGCRVAPVPGANTAATPPAATWSGPTGHVAIAVTLPNARRVQWVESFRATRFVGEVTGAGLNGWQPLVAVDGTTGEFGAMGVDGLRVASLAAKVPAGDRRIFRVKVYDTTPEPDLLLTELWGVGDVPANVNLQDTFPITVKPMTTPTGEIFYRLLQVDPAKAMTLPIDNVQHFVEELLNTNWITGEALRPGVPQVNPGVLDMDKVTAAIIRGNNSVPFQIPAPIPDALLARDAADPLKRSLPDAMRRRGRAHVQVVDVHGRTISRPFVFYLTDGASQPQRADDATPADARLDEVAPGSWDVVATDLAHGRSARKPVSVAAGQEVSVAVVAAPDTEPVAGTYNVEADAADSFNGEQVPARLAYLSDPGGLFVHAGQVTYVDAGNQRVRRFALDSPPEIVQTLAGTGLDGHKGDGGNGLDAWLTLDNLRDVVVDKLGVAYVSQSDNTVRSIAPDGTIRNFWAPGGYSYEKLSRLAYDAARHHLYVACPRSGALYRLDLNVYDGSNPALAYNAAQVATTGIFKVPINVGDYYARADVEVSGDHVFYANTNLSGVATVHRWTIGTAQVDQLIGQAATGPAGEETLASALTEYDIRGLAADAWGNLFFRANAGLYRLTGAAGPAAACRVKLVLADANLNQVAFDRQTQQLYLQTRAPFKNAAGVVRQVPVIQRLTP